MLSALCRCRYTVIDRSFQNAACKACARNTQAAEMVAPGSETVGSPCHTPASRYSGGGVEGRGGGGLGADELGAMSGNGGLCDEAR